MGKKRRSYVEHHKQSLGEQIEDPETYGVRVSKGTAMVPLCPLYRIENALLMTAFP